MAVFDLDRFGGREHRPRAGARHLAAAGAGNGAVRAALEKLTATDMVDLAGNAPWRGPQRPCGLLANLRNLEYEHSNAKHVYRLLFEGLFVSLGSAMFSLLGFYIPPRPTAPSGYARRVFADDDRGRAGDARTDSLRGVDLVGVAGRQLWLLEIPNSAAFRAITFGAGVAGLVMAFRMWLSIESESFDGGGGVTWAWPGWTAAGSTCWVFLALSVPILTQYTVKPARMDDAERFFEVVEGIEPKRGSTLS